MRAGIYLRISDDRDNDERGVTRQGEDAIKRIESRGWQHAETYTDNDLSAAGKVRRPRFEAMVNAVEAGLIDVVIGWTIDRVCRTPRDRLRLLEVGKEHGLLISLVRGSDMDLSTPAGRLAADILGAVAAHEIEQKSDRQRRAAQQAAEQGRWIGGRRPFGFEPDGVTVRPDEKKLIVAGYEAVLAGMPLRSIVRAWNAAGLFTGKVGYRTGEPTQWRADSVRTVLLNPRYYGQRRHLGEVVGPAMWPALVDEETWRAATDILTDPSRRAGTPGAVQLLTGFARCGVCGLTVHGGGASHKQAIYRCRSMLHVNRLAAPADAYVEEVFLAWASGPAAVAAVVEQDRPDAAPLREEVQRLRARLDVLAVELGDDPDITPREYRLATGRVREQLRATEAALADAGRRSVLAPLVVAGEVRAAWEKIEDGAQRRAMLAAAFRVSLHPVGRGARIFRPETITVEPNVERTR